MSLKIGETLKGRYKVEALLGEGGMGAVYRAYDKLRNETCAVKEFRLGNLPSGEKTRLHEAPDETRLRENGQPVYSREKAEEQFLLEAQLLSQLDHPNLPKVTDYFTAGENTYLVMFLVEGQDLEVLMEKRGETPFPEAQVTVWMKQVADAVAYCHSKGVIHRDIKPANVIQDKKGKVYLVDFGIASLSEASGNLPGTSAITPGYSPPEQYRQEKADSRSDIYSLGATMYALLTAREPTEATKRMDGEKLPGARQNNSLISARMDEVIQRAMSIKVGDRFQSVDEMRRALGWLLAAWKKNLGIGGGILAGFITLGFVGIKLLSVISPTHTPTPFPTDTPTISATIASIPTDTPTPTITATPTITPTFTATIPSPTPTPGTFVIRPKDGMKMVRVPAGEFMMGTNENFPVAQPQHRVVMSEYWIDETDVTNAMFQKFIGETGWRTEAEKKTFGEIYRQDKKLITINNTTWLHPRGPGTDFGGLDHPVVQVSWNDAHEYCLWAERDWEDMQVNLPTEAQWEKAARGTDAREYPWVGESFGPGKLNYGDDNLYNWIVAWNRAGNKDTPPWGGGGNDGYLFTSPAGNYPKGASPYGALDMAGNVMQWVSDFYKDGFQGQKGVTDPEGPAGGGVLHVVKGSFWKDTERNSFTFIRNGRAANYTTDFIGFRCAASKVKP